MLNVRFTRRTNLILALCAVAFLIPCGLYAEFCQDGICGDPESCLRCNVENWECDQPCKRITGTWTTCGAFGGAPANDLDNDGVSNTSDNCLCTPNSSQANCDGDSWGDACDSFSEKWVIIGVDRSICHVDKDDHIINFDIELYSKEIYRNNCGGATCVKKILEAENRDCFGLSDVACCGQIAKHFDPSLGICNFIDQDFCGSPQCSF